MDKIYKDLFNDMINVSDDLLIYSKKNNQISEESKEDIKELENFVRTKIKKIKKQE